MSNQAGLGIGNKVHTQEINEYPDDLKQEYLRLSEWVRSTYQRYGTQIWIKLIDPQSLVGLWKHLRHRVRRYPTFVVEGTDVFAGWESVTEALLQVDQILETRPSADQASQ